MESSNSTREEFTVKINQYIQFFVVCLCLVSICGCITYSKFVKTFSENPQITPSEAKTSLGKPFRERYDNGIVIQDYELNLGMEVQSAIFYNNRLVYYGPTDFYQLLNLYRDLGVVSEEDYHRQYQQAQEDDYRSSIISLERARLLQEKELTEKQLEYQKKKELEDKMWGHTTTDCDPTFGGGFSCTSRKGF